MKSNIIILTPVYNDWKNLEKLLKKIKKMVNKIAKNNNISINTSGLDACPSYTIKSSVTDSPDNVYLDISDLVKDFIDVNYTFNGEPLSDTQPMQLPTDEVTITDIEKGAAQAAWQQLTGVLFVDQSTQSVNGQIKMQRDKLDKLETEVEYTEGTQSTYTLSTQTIDRLLKPYIVGQSGYARVLL